MKLAIKLDYDGTPYLVMLSEKPANHHTVNCAEDQLLEHFIRLGRENGVAMQNEADMNTRTDYASIRIKKATEQK